jgi:hypothetical protein
VNGERTRALARAEPVADDLAFEDERASRASDVRRPGALGCQRTVRDADCREIQHGTEMKGEARTARVIPAGCIDEKDVRWLRESAQRGLEERTLAEREQAGLVRGAGSARHDDALAAVARGGPRRVAGVA